MRRWGLLAAGLAVGVVIALGLVRGTGIGARRDPMFLEARLARASWRWLVPRQTRDLVNPVPDDLKNLYDARKHWADHCATCHANDGSGDTLVGRHVYPSSPDLRQPRTQGLTDGELFYAIEEGIPWTAMPAWGTGTREGQLQSWQLVRLVRHLPHITTEELAEMERWNPKRPPDPVQEQEIDDFLKGPPVPAPAGKKGR